MSRKHSEPALPGQALLLPAAAGATAGYTVLSLARHAWRRAVTKRVNHTELAAIMSAVVSDDENEGDEYLEVMSSSYFFIKLDFRTDNLVFEFEQPFYPADGKPAFPGKDVIVDLQSEARETWDAMYGVDVPPEKMAVSIEWHSNPGDDDGDGALEIAVTGLE